MKREIRILLLIGIGVLLLWGISSADLRCKMCGKSISGTYYKSATNEIYCEACWKSHTVCSQCGRLVQSTIQVNNANLCRDCYIKLDHCSICEKPLIGNYTEYPKLGLKVCSQCERDKPHCEKCGVPLKNSNRFGGAILCERCAGKTECCHSCGEALLANYTFFEGNKDFKYCDKCVDKYPRCEDCGAPSGKDATKLNDGRYLCPDCRRIAYFDPGLIGSIKKKVLAFISVNMGMTIKHQIDFSLEGLSFLRQKDKNVHGDINGLFYRRGDNFDIYVLYGLREKDLISVIAHEFTHAWQAENCPDKMAFEDQEGFAQWVAFKTLKFFNQDSFADLLTDSNDAYARGLRKMLQIESRGRAKAVFDEVKNSSDSY
jgi:recombinational DNA repair protein (RecF pathway)